MSAEKPGIEVTLEEYVDLVTQQRADLVRLAPGMDNVLFECIDTQIRETAGKVLDDLLPALTAAQDSDGVAVVWGMKQLFTPDGAFPFLKVKNPNRMKSIMVTLENGVESIEDLLVKMKMIPADNSQASEVGDSVSTSTQVDLSGMTPESVS
jgi:hypothetical protein